MHFHRPAKFEARRLGEVVLAKLPLDWIDGPRRASFISAPDGIKAL